MKKQIMKQDTNNTWSRSMKKSLLVGLSASLLLLTGCGTTERVIEGESPVNAGASEATVAQTPATEAGTATAEAPAVASKGYVFEYQGVTMAIDEDASAAISALPEAISYFEAASCAFEGLDKIYTYSSFELDTYPQGDKDYISSIIFKDDSVSTPEGISIGDLTDKVIEAYGSDYEEQENMMTYTKDNMRLRFILQGKSVISIEYQTTVLDE